MMELRVAFSLLPPLLPRLDLGHARHRGQSRPEHHGEEMGEKVTNYSRGANFEGRML